MPQRLRQLELTEVSLVASPANKGAKVLLHKAAPPELLAGITQARKALETSIASINADAAITDKSSAIAKATSEHDAHLVALVDEKMQKAESVKSEGDDTMSKAIAKALGLSETATEAEILAAVVKAGSAEVAEVKAKLAKSEADLKLAKLSDDEKQYTVEKGMSEVLKAGFADMTPEERKKKMKDDPSCAKTDETLIVKGTTIKKSVVGEATFEIFKSQQADIQANAEKIAKQEDEAKRSAVIKRAESLGHVGAAAEVGALIHDITKADPKAGAAMETLLTKVEAVLAKSAVFTEFGSGRGGVTKAVEAIAAKAAELRKADPKLTIEKARMMARDQNSDLAKQEQAEMAETRKRAA